MPTQDYVVTFELWITADNPRQAAEFALLDMQDKSLPKPVLEVVGEDGKHILFDLSDPSDQGREVTE